MRFFNIYFKWDRKFWSFLKGGLTMNWRSKKGFTLSELLIATAILALAMSGLLLLFVNCAFLDQANRNKSIATAHAAFVIEDIMEFMRDAEVSSLQNEIVNNSRWNWDSCTICNELGCVSPPPCLSPCQVYPCVLNSESITTTCIDVDPTNDLNPIVPPKIVEITITVSWKDRGQVNTRSLELKTLISKR